MPTMGSALIGGLAAVGAVVIAGGLALASRGTSSLPEPGRLETAVTRAARDFLVPRAARRRANPVALDAAVLVSARAHFADHCATCHGNDGRGAVDFGRRLYPRAPDLTAPATQRLSDGELFYYIENGVRLTGMPAFAIGTPEGENESWALVHFVRHLPAMNPGEVAEMERLNPTSRAALEEELEMERFLAGEEAQAPPHSH